MDLLARALAQKAMRDAVAGTIGDKGITNVKLADNYEYCGSLNGGDLNTVSRSGVYIISSEMANKPPGVSEISAYLWVENFGNFIWQSYTPLNDKEKLYRRQMRPAQSQFSPWQSLIPEKPYFSSKKLVCFGDSITALGVIPEQIALRTGLTAYNVGFGGCRMGDHSDPNYDVFGMTKLADAIVSGNFTVQDAAAVTLANYVIDEKLAILKTIDFTTVSYLTIFYGTNDFTGGVPIGTDADNTSATFKGAINYAVQKICTAFPSIRVLFISPMWRARQVANDGKDSDNFPVNGVYLTEYVEAVKTLSAKHHLPAFDLYHNCGINLYNYTSFMSDGLHPNSPGYYHVGDKIAGFITASC